MSRKIFLLDSEDNLTPMEEAEYDSEDLLQRLLETHSDLLGGDQISEEAPRRWVLVDRECGIPNEPQGGNWWSLDHLFLDQDAVPTLVEVKRADDPRIRREVVGQMLDYAANLVAHLPVDELRRRLEERAGGQEAAEDKVTRLLEDSEDDTDYEAFWLRVRDNLQAGRLRLLFVADAVPPELRRVVEFLNERMAEVEVLAVEIKKFAGSDLQTLVPRVLGQTASSGGKSDRLKRKWDEDSFLKELARRFPRAVEPARKIIRWAEQKMPEIYWGEGARSGSFFPGITVAGVWSGMIALWTNGGVEMQFQHISRREPFNDEALLRELFDRVNAIGGINLPADRLKKRPSFPIELLASENRMKEFIRVLEWSLGKFLEAEGVESARGTSSTD